MTPKISWAMAVKEPLSTGKKTKGKKSSKVTVVYNKYFAHLMAPFLSVAF